MAVLDGASGSGVTGVSGTGAGAARLTHGSTIGNSSDSEVRNELDEAPSPGMPGALLPSARLSVGAPRVFDSATHLHQDGVGRGPFLRPHHDPTASVAAAAAASIAKVKEQELLREQSEGKGGVEGRSVVAGLQCSDDGFKKDVRDLAELLSKLNPMAKEFVPPTLAEHRGYDLDVAFRDGFGLPERMGHGNEKMSAYSGRKKKSNYSHGKRMNNRTSMAQREETIRRTVYVSDIDQQVTEEQLAALFISCGQVVDCRICGDPNSILRFAFIEFTDEEGARAALSLSGTMLGYYPVKVLPSKTAIAPVNPTFLPRSEDEREMCARTIYCTNIDKRISQADVKLFFETLCGKVHRLRLLGDHNHAARIAFVEFVMAESAIAALNCSGVVLRSLPIRISPSKTPVRPRSPHSSTP